MKKIFILWMLVALSGCSEDRPKETDVYEIRDMGELATTEYTIGKVIQVKDNKEWYKYGDRNILISCKARVKAGVDLSALSESDVAVDGKTVKITLPPAKVLSLDMDPNLIRTEVEDVSGFRQSFSHEEKNRALALGEQSIRENVEKTNILQTAEKNARIFVTDFYRQLGFEHVTVVFKRSYVEEITAR